MSLSYEIFIISWKHQHDKALSIASELGTLTNSITIVYSDPDEKLELKTDLKVIRRSDEGFFSDKLYACIESVTAELMFVIHADCSSDNWKAVIANSIAAFSIREDIAICAPVIRGTYYEIETTRIAKLGIRNLSLVALIDTLCFCVSSRIVSRLKTAHISRNTYGWGIDRLMAVASQSQNMPMVVDESSIVFHEYGSGYPTKIATQQMMQFIQKEFSIMERVHLHLIMSYVESRKHNSAR